MLDIKFVRDNPDAVKENIKKKFQDAKLPLVDEVIEKDAKYRECLKEVESLKAARNKLSKANGPLFGQLKKCDDEAKKAELQAQIDANNAAVKADADKRRRRYISCEIYRRKISGRRLRTVISLCCPRWRTARRSASCSRRRWSTASRSSTRRCPPACRTSAWTV